MSKKRYAFFISSVVEGMKRERDAASDVIGHEHVPIRSEKFISNNPSKKLIRDKIRECDCYVGIFNTKWGSVPKKDNPKNLSVTALEYMEAKELGLPVFIIVSKNKKKDKELSSFLKKIGDYEDGENWNRYKKIEELSTDLALYMPKLIKQIKQKPVSTPKIIEKLKDHNQKFTIIDSLINNTYEKPTYFDKVYKEMLCFLTPNNPQYSIIIYNSS